LLYNYFQHIKFAQPFFFGLLLLLPALVYWYVKNNKTNSASIAISTVNKNGLASLKSSLIHLPFYLRLLALAFLTIALANPQTSFNEKTSEGEGIDIALCIDVSGSMTAIDLKPNRLEAAKTVAINFVNNRYSDKIAIIAFAGESFTQCPLTTDKSIVVNAIENMRCGLLADGTSIGDGLATAIDRLRASKTKSKVVILLTDGENNGGLINPKYAKEIAKTFGIKVYTIGVSTEGTTIKQEQTALGIVNKEVTTSIDEKLLTEIATETGGKYYRAKDNTGLNSIYATIDTLEKSKVEITSLTKYSNKYLPFAIMALACLVIETLFKYLVFRKFP
jgi:Ca-activated chloride channel homolog